MIAVSSGEIGVLLAVASATAFALQFLFVRFGTENGIVADAVLVTLLCNSLLIVPLAAVSTPGTITETYTPASATAFAAAGVVGVFLARMCLFRGVETVGASRTSAIVAANVLFATAFAYLFLGERTTIGHLIGIAFVVGGVGALARENLTAEGGTFSLTESGRELVFPVGAAVLIGIEPIFISKGLAAGTPALAGLAVMILAGSVGFGGYWLATRHRRERSITTPAARWYVAAGIVTTVGFVGYFAALARAPVSVVMPILQTSPLIVLLLSAFFVPDRLERVTPRLVAAATVIVFGAFLVTVFG